MRGRFTALAIGLILIVGLLALVGWLRSAPPAFDGKVLRWGGDASGGAPYIIERESTQSPTGFEGELADYLAGRLGVTARFEQKNWDMLPQDLARGDIDVVLNGYEWSAEREHKMASTIPYFVYRLQLIVAADSPLRDWDDLRRARSGKRLKVGVLRDSAAHRYLEKAYRADEVEVIALSIEGSTGLMGMVRNGKLDATVQDLVAAVYYVQQNHDFGDLRLAGAPIEPGYFVLYVRANDTELRQQLNDGIRAALKDGTLKRIYHKYGLWNKDQEGLAELAEHWPP